MIKNEKQEELLKIDDWGSFYVVADFDRTITNGNSKTSWSILAASDLVPKEYTADRNRLYDIYRPIEIDPDMPLAEKSAKVKEWFELHIGLFIKYGIREELFEKAARDLRIMEFRKGAKRFLDAMAQMGVPVIIISAGIGNFIECFLRNNGCYYDNIYVSSNKITFRDGVAAGVAGDVIHSLNKNEVSLPEEIKSKLEGRPNVLLLGDQASDLNMVDEMAHERVLKVAFVAQDAIDEEQIKSLAGFDLVMEPGEDYDDMMSTIDRENVYEKNTDKRIK